MAQFVSLEIDGFRNLSEVRLRPHPKLNLISGANGAGKTALLEAIHFLVRGKSFRSVQPQELIGREAERLLIRSRVKLDESDVPGTEAEAAVLRQRQKRQQIRWKGEVAKGFAKISSSIPLQVFLPNLSDLVFGGPGERRRWLDWGSFHVEHRYLEYWRRYTKCLQQRNALLRSIGEVESARSSRELEIYTNAMMEAAEKVTQSRTSYLEQWEEPFRKRLRQLTGWERPAELPVMVFRPNGSSKSLSLRELLGESASREVKSGMSVYGPHRADCELTTSLVPTASIASRGQGKLIALAMMIAQADTISASSGLSSVFLMDDLDAELDDQARSRLYEVLDDCRAQVFITGVRPGVKFDRTGSAQVVPSGYAMFHVEQGSIIQETV